MSQTDPCYDKPTLHAVAYVFNWASVWLNPIVYIGAQKKYQVAKRTGQKTVTSFFCQAAVRQLVSCCLPNPKQSVPKAFIPSYDVSEGSNHYKSEQDSFSDPRTLAPASPGT